MVKQIHNALPEYIDPNNKNPRLYMLSKQSDEDLMIDFRDGNEHAFSELYSRHKGGLYRFFYRQCSNASDAQELLQDVWFNLIRARERYQVSAKFTTYLYRMAHNRLVDYYRRRSNSLPVSYSDNYEADCETLVADHSADPEIQMDVKRKIKELQKQLDSLPEAQREAFMLREEAGLSLEQIAATTGVNVETAKSRLRYAVAKIRKNVSL